nr:hypothetical protein HK105_007606 [Polyrhizophydium stewartii]
MGCGASAARQDDVLESRAAKKRALAAIDSGTAWRRKWLEFTDAMEQSQLTAAHWAEDDSDELFTECLKTLSIQSTELFILSRGFLSALEAHISLLSDVLSLQRDLHASIKMRAKSRIQLQRTIRAESLRRRRRRVGHDVSAAPANPGQAAQQSASGTQQAAAAPASPHPHQAAGSQPHWRAPGRRRSRNGRVVPQDVEPWSSSGALQRAKSASNSLSAHPANSTLVTNIAPSNIYLISKLKDKEHICRYKLDELDQMVHAKSERLDWAKRERVPRMLLALLEHYADMWLRYSELFNDMKEIVNTHKWWEISEEERAARRRTELLRQWLETADDCSKIWEALRSIEERHLVDLVDWWSLMPLSNDAGEVVSASAPPARQLCEIQPTYKQLCLTWMRALQASPPVTMVSQQHLTTTTGPTLPPLKRPSANVLRVLRMFSETLSQINSRECNVGQFLKDVEQAAADMKATQRQQEQLVASSISKYGALNQRRQRQIASQSAAASAQLAKKALALDTARYKVDRAMLDNRELRHKQLANAHMELWDALVGASKEFADGYRDIGMSFDSAQGDGQQQLSRMAMQGSNTSMAVSGGNGGMATAMSGGYGFGIFGQSASGAAASAGYTSGGPLSSFSTGKGVTMGSSVMGSRSVTVAISSQPPGTAVQAGSGIVSPVDTAPSEVEGTGAEAGPPPSLHHRMVYSPFEETKAGGAPPNVPLGAVSPDRSQMRSASKNSIRPMLDSTNSTSMPSLFGSSIRLSVDIPTVRVDAPAEEVWQQRRGSSPTQATALTGRPESAHTSSSRAAIRVDSQAMFGTPLSPIASLPSLATTAFGSAPDIQVQQPRRNDGSQQLSLSSSSSGSARPRASTVPTRSSDHSLESADLKGIAQLARIASEASSTHRSQADNSGPAVEQQAGDGHVAAAPQSIQKPPSSSAGSLDKHASASSAPTQQQPQPLTPSPAAVASALASQAGSTPSDPPARGPAPALVHHATVNAGSLVSPGRDNQPRGETLSEQSATVTPNLRTGGAPPVLPSVSFLDRAATASSSRNPFVDNGAGLIAAVSGTSLEDTYDAIQNQRRRESAPVAQAVDSARASMMAPGRPKTAKSFVSSIVMSMNTASSIHIPSEIASSASLQDRIEGQSVGTDYSTGMLDQSGVLTIAASASYGPRFFQLLRSGQDGSAPGLLSGEAAQSGASGAADTDNGSVIGVYGDRHGSESMYGRSAEQIDRSLTGTQSGGVYDADSTLGQISPRASTTSYQHGICI